MLTLLFLPISIGIANLANLLDLPAAVKALMLALMLGPLSLDFLLSKRMESDKRPIRAKLLLFLGLFQAIITWQIVSPLLTDNDVFEFSFTAMTLQGFVPFCLLFLHDRKPIFHTISATDSLLTGVCISAVAAVALSFSPLGPLYTSFKYATDSPVIGDTLIRVCLPLFPGTVPGGIYCGLTLTLGLTILLFRLHQGSRLITYVAVLSIVGGLAGLLQTGTRNGVVAVVLVTLLLFLTERLSRRFRTTTLAAALVLVSACLPFAYQPLQPIIADRALGPFLEFITRGENEREAFTLAGRSLIWSEFGSGMDSPSQWVFGNGPSGELALGLNREFNYAVHGFDSDNTYLSHFHNLSLNMIYSAGALGLLVFWVTWLLAWTYSGTLLPYSRTRLTTRALLLFFPVSGATDSLLSVSYEYFGVLFILTCVAQIVDRQSFPADCTPARPETLTRTTQLRQLAEQQHRLATFPTQHAFTKHPL